MAGLETDKGRKVEMKILSLTEQSKRNVLDTLKFIHGDDFSLKDKSFYRDKGSKLDRHYWVDRGNLMVRGGVNYSAKRISNLPPHEQVNMYALSKLTQYGFYEAHCSEALYVTSGDVGAAYELLMSKYFNIPLPEPGSVDESIIEERAFELESLKSIYENSCEERITNQLWIINLELPYLIDHKVEDKVVQSVKNPKKSKDVCKFFSKGHCRFKDRCKFLHINPESVVSSPKKDDFDEHKYKFQLEIRFPSGCKYPFEPPLASLVTKSSSFPKYSCLIVTKRLLDELQEKASLQQPCIFELIDLLTNRPEDVIKVLNARTPVFYDPTMRLFPQEEEEANNDESNSLDFTEEVSLNKRTGPTRQISRENEEIKRRCKSRQSGMMYKSMLQKRVKLPAWPMKDEILSIIRENQVVVISGDTGCGKSTQVPQFLLDEWLQSNNGDHIEIICTQPRRISAIGVAERVAAERAEKIADIVGYQIRLENKLSSSTRLLYCTTGILLRRLEGDPLLKSVTHIIVDEVHERSEESDFLLLILKDLLPIRRDLKVILMSATLNPTIFCDYFCGAPIINIPGKTFPVEQLFLEDILERCKYVLEEYSAFAKKVNKLNSRELENLENEVATADINSFDAIPPIKVRDESLSVKQIFSRYEDYSILTRKTIFLIDPDKINYELIESTLLWIVEGDHDFPKKGSILVFLPGLSDITSMHEQLQSHPTFSEKNGKYLLIPLHSSLSSEEQGLVFRKTKDNIRKIILSTNIAETSVTIDDCVFVVDTGRMKEKRFDSNKNMESLDTTWVSRANAVQRKGRAGRVMPGVCIHLFTRHRFEYVLDSQPIPEIQRAPLEQLVLRIKTLERFANFDVHDILGRTLEPPPPLSIDGALDRLRNVGALNESNDLTALGHHLASLPVDVRIGKIIIFGTMLQCLDSSLTIAACLSHKSPFVAPFNKKDEAQTRKKEFFCGYSDHLTILKAYQQWLKTLSKGYQAARVFANENFLSMKTLTTLADVKTHFLELLIDIGFVSKSVRVPRRKNGVDKILELTGSELNSNGENQRLLAAILCASLYPNIVKILTPEKQYTNDISGAVPLELKAEDIKFKTKKDGFVDLHPSSINYQITNFPSPYLVFQEKIKTSRVFIRDCSMVPMLPLVLFSAGSIKVELHGGQFVISLDDGWILFLVQTNEVAELLEAIKNEFLLLLEEKIKNPSLNLQTNPKGKKIISTIVQIVTSG